MSIYQYIYTNIKYYIYIIIYMYVYTYMYLVSIYHIASIQNVDNIHIFVSEAPSTSRGFACIGSIPITHLTRSTPSCKRQMGI